MTIISNLTCEYLTNPLGIDVRQPRFRWQKQSDRRSARQTAYKISVAPSETCFSSGAGLIWNSGKIESDRSIHVPYDGLSLASGQRVYWQAQVRDKTGEVVESSTAWWEMGPLDRTDWEERWIGAPFFGGPRLFSPAPNISKQFSLSKPCGAARLLATAIGLYECNLNGARVGDAFLTPGWVASIMLTGLIF